MIEDEASGSVADPLALGRLLAERLLARGAERLVTEARAAGR